MRRCAPEPAEVRRAILLLAEKGRRGVHRRVGRVDREENVRIGLAVNLVLDLRDEVRVRHAVAVEVEELHQDGSATAAANLPYVSGKAIEFGGMAVSITGAPADGDSFEAVPSQPALNLFTVLDDAIATLSTPALGSGALAQAVNHGMRDLDASLAGAFVERGGIWRGTPPEDRRTLAPGRRCTRGGGTRSPPG